MEKSLRGNPFDLERFAEQVLLKLDEVQSEIRNFKKQKNMVNGDVVLDFRDTCQILHLSERQIRRLRLEKKLVGFVAGRKRMYLMSEVTRYLKTVQKQDEERYGLLADHLIGKNKTNH